MPPILAIFVGYPDSSVQHISEIRAPQSQRPHAGHGLNVPQGAPSADADVSDNEGEGWVEAAQSVGNSKPDASANVDAADGWAEWVALVSQ